MDEFAQVSDYHTDHLKEKERETNKWRKTGWKRVGETRRKGLRIRLCTCGRIKGSRVQPGPSRPLQSNCYLVLIAAGCVLHKWPPRLPPAPSFVFARSTARKERQEPESSRLPRARTWIKLN